jgi:hippurate hydrolase
MAKKTRPSKPDFKPLYMEHREIVDKATKSNPTYMNHEKMVELRHLLHTHPESGFKEFRTQRKVREILMHFGFKQEEIKDCAGTGLIVDIKGTGPDDSDNKVKAIALRADMDGLPIPENNQELPYKTTTDQAHMCGHDGHMVTLLGVA